MAGAFAPSNPADWINVCQHGASGDGWTDNSAAFQASFNLAKSGQLVFIPQGTYVLKTVVTAGSGVLYYSEGTLTGAGSISGGTAVAWNSSGGPTGSASGDLSGSYPSPTVAKLDGVTISGTPSAGEVISATSSTAASWGTAGSGSVAAVTAGDTSIVVGGTTGEPTIETGTLDVIAADHPPAGNWSNNSKKITSLANGSGAQDAAAFGQIPTALPPNGSAGGDLTGSYPNPVIASVQGVAISGTPAAGNVLSATSSSAAAWDTFLCSSVAAEALTSGECIMPRYLANMGPFTLTTAQVNLTYWVAATSGTSTGVTTYSGPANAATGIGYAEIGVYSVAAGTGNLTLLCSTGNIASTAWTATNAAYTSTWNGYPYVNFTRVAGQCYALGIIAIGGTMPQLQGYTGIASLLSLASPAAPQVTGAYDVVYTTVAAGSNGGNVSGIASWGNPSAGVLDAVNPQAANFPTSGEITVVTSTGFAIINYTGTTTTSFTGCVYAGGSGTLATGASIWSNLLPTVSESYIATFSVGTASAAVVAP